MPLSKETVQYVADLSRIELSAAELQTLASQLQAIIGFIDQLKTADVSAIAGTSHILPLTNVLREDSLTGSLPVQKALVNAPDKKGGFFAVPRVIE